MVRIFPSLMSADQLNLAHEIKKLEPHCDGFHLDVMDNHFVPNLTMGPMTVNQIAQATQQQLFVHLMVDNPEQGIARLQLKANSIVSFHIESTNTPQPLIATIKQKGWLPGLALNPKTPVRTLYPHLDSLAVVLLMAVEPGFSGQEFLEIVLPKIDELLAYKKIKQSRFILAIDGGINTHNLRMLAQKGVELFCVGSALFGDQDSITALEQLYQAAQVD